MKSLFNRIIIWGLKTQIHSHRFIHQGFYENAKKLGLNAIWVDNKEKNNEILNPGDLVISVNVAGDKLKVRQGVYYCLHNFTENLQHFINQINPENFINLQVYTSYRLPNTERIDSATYLNRSSRTLIQPWGTDLLQKEFRPPVKSTLNGISFWIGSVWNNALNQGNVNEYHDLKSALKTNKISLIKARVPNSLAIPLIRKSVIAPSIAGRWQVENNYLPCRMFKNISYGQMGITNVKGFEEIFGNAYIYSENISELVEKSLSIPKSERFMLISEQQKLISDHTYEQKLKNIFMAFDLLDQ